jgi:hypothetical protein
MDDGLFFRRKSISQEKEGIFDGGSAIHQSPAGGKERNV